MPDGAASLRLYRLADEALDDRLAIVGTAGSGKTYLASELAERLERQKKRSITFDALGVFWGRRLMADGRTPSPYAPVIFGGPHGDLPLTEHAGALIGESIADAKESAIIDLTSLGTKAAERRFMLACLSALYRHANKEPVHLIFDEADMWAPQKLLDKEGDAAKLLGMMETIVRRGRIKGFIPWLITQRPAVLSKDVLSQADGVIALKLTAEQDRRALGGWVEATADAAEWRAIDAELPKLQRGEGVVWIPGRGILAHAAFPTKETYDSSSTPKRGEKRSTAELKALDLAALKTKLAAVQVEVAANDPAALKREVARLNVEIAQLRKSRPTPAPVIQGVPEKEVERREAARFQAGFVHGFANALAKSAAALSNLKIPGERDVPYPYGGERGPRLPEKRIAPPDSSPTPAPIPKPARKLTDSMTGLSGPQLTLLRALAWWRAMGHDAPLRPQVASIAGWAPTSSHLRNRISELRQAGMIEDRPEQRIALTDAGVAAAPEPDMSATMHEGIRRVLTGPQAAMFDVLVNEAGAPLSRESLAEAVGWGAESSHLRNRLSELRTLQIIEDLPDKRVKLQEWLL